MEAHTHADASSATSRTQTDWDMVMPPRVGRYLLEEELGRGAFGAVYAGTDPQLGRPVAIKLLRCEDEQETVRIRHVREGQALAQVADPHVVQIYDVGIVEKTKQVYLAMELIEGTTLRQWLAAAPRSVEEILRVLEGAAQGLAAAHAAEIVHRDFKPANVLVTRDGMAKVVDFGLARAATGSSSGGQSTLSGVDHLPDVTATGTLMGTPHYMPPEVIRGDAWSPAGDQFSFCVTLHEALFGKRPFAGRTFELLAANVSANRRVDRPDVDVPAAVLRALDRGLAPEPAERFATMTDLVAALRRRHRSWRGVAAVAVAGTVLAGGVVAAALFGGDAPDNCGAEAENALPAWSKAERAAAAERLGVGKRSNEMSTVDAAVAAWVDLWRAEYTELCRADDGAGKEGPIAQRRRCLEAQASRFEARLRALHSARSLKTLESPDVCRLPARYGSLPPPPPAAIADAVARLERELEEVKAQANRKNADAQARLEDVAKRARALGYGPLTTDALHAQALQALTDLQVEDAVGYLRQAIEVANASGYEVATSWMHADLCRAFGQEADREEEALRHCEHAIAVAQRFGRDDLHGRALGQRGKVLKYFGRYADARRDMERAVELIEKALGPADLTTLAAKGNLGNALWNLGQLEESLALTREVAAGFEELFGRDDPMTLTALSNAGALELEMGDLAGGELTVLEVLTGLESIYGPKHPALLHELINLGELESRRGRFEKARAYYDRARGLEFGENAAGRRARLEVDEKFAGLALTKGDADEARRLYIAVLDETVEIFGPKSANAASAHYYLGTAFKESGDAKGSRAHLEEALAIATTLGIADTAPFSGIETD